MDNNLNTIKKMQEEKGQERIKKLQEKVDTTRYNIEVSEEIIAETPSESQQEKLTRKNIQRQHGIAGIEKKIREIKQALEE